VQVLIVVEEGGKMIMVNSGMGEKRNRYRISDRNPERKKPLSTLALEG
jgi:hypothetical protein